MSDRQTPQWNNSSSDDDEFDRIDSSSGKSSSPFFTDDSYEDDYDDYDESDDENDAYGSGSNAYGSGGSQYGGATNRAGSSSYGSSGSTGSSPYSSNRYSSGGTGTSGSTSNSLTTNRYSGSSSTGGASTGGASESSSTSGRFKSSPWGASSTSSKDTKDKEKSGGGGVLGRFGRGNKTEKKAEPKSKDKKSGGGVGGRLGNLRKMLPSGKSDDKKDTPTTSSTTSTYGRNSTVSTTRTVSTPGFGQSQPAAGSKPEKKKSRFGLSLPSFGRSRDGGKKSQPATPRNAKRAKPLPSRSKQPRITRTGISLDLKLDIAGWAMLIMSGVIFFGAISSNQGNVSRTILELLYQLVGVGWIAVPAVLAGAGIWLIWRHFGETAPEANYEHIIGWGITYLGFVATAHYIHLLTTIVYSVEHLAALSSEAASSGYGGGWLGHQIYMFLMQNFGDYGTFFILLGWWGIGIIVATDISFADIFHFVDRGRHAIINRTRQYQVARAAKKRAKEAVTVGAAASLDSSPVGATAVNPAATLEAGQAPLLTAETTAQPERSIPIIRHRSHETASAEVAPSQAAFTQAPEPVVAEEEEEAPIPVEISSPNIAAYQPAEIEQPFDNETIKLNRGPAPMRIRRRTFSDYDYGNNDDSRSTYDDYAADEAPTEGYGEPSPAQNKQSPTRNTSERFIKKEPDEEPDVTGQPYQYSPPTVEKPVVEAPAQQAPAEQAPVEQVPAEQAADEDMPAESRTDYHKPTSKPASDFNEIAFTGIQHATRPDADGPILSPDTTSPDSQAPGGDHGESSPYLPDWEDDEEEPAEEPVTPYDTAEENTVEEIEEETDDLAADLLQPAKPRSAGQRTLRPLRQRGAGLSPAEKAALMGEFATQSDEDDPDQFDEMGDSEPDEMTTVYEPVDEPASFEEEIPTIELDEDLPTDDEVDEDEDFIIDGSATELTEELEQVTKPEEQPTPAPVEAAPAASPPPPEPALEAEPEPAEVEVPEPVKAPVWIRPDYREVLDPGAEQNINDDVLLDRARIIEDTLASFGAPGKVVEVNPGPVITQFGIEPDYIESRGGKRTRVKVQSIARLADDLALSLAARSIRIEAPVPGKGFVGIEVPNSETSLVSLRDVMDSPEFNKIDSPLAIGLGQSVDGSPVSADLTTMPHLLVAGTTGSGKSVCVNAIIACLLLKNTPDTLRLIMVDPKRVELTGYNGIPHLVAPVVVDLERIVGVLKWVTREMDDRYKKFNERSARNIISYNNMLGPDESPLPYLVVIIDELADLMMLAPDETERVLTRLAQMARATGIHLIISTQRPSVDVVTGLIKANFPSRVAFAVASSVDSRVILDQPGAERLLGRGDMLFQAPDAAAPTRLQGVYVSDTELDRLTNHWKGIHTITKNQKPASPMEASLSSNLSSGSGRSAKQVGPIRSRAEKYGSASDRQSASSPAASTSTNFWDEVASSKTQERTRSSSNEVDELYDESVAVVRQLKKASVSLLQRQLRIGYTRAARLIDVMEERGIVGPAQSGSKPRKVIGYTDTEVNLDMDAPQEPDPEDTGDTDAE